MQKIIVVLFAFLFLGVFASATSSREFLEYKSFCPELFDSGLTMEQRDYLLGFSRNIVLEFFGLPVISLPESEGIFPENQHRVYVTFLVDNKVVACQGSGTKDLLGAVKKATENSLKDDRFEGMDSKDIDGLVIWIDVFSLPAETKDFFSDFIPGEHGVKITKEKKFAVFKPSVAVTKSYSLEKIEERLCKKASFSDNCFSDPAVTVEIFSSDSFAENEQKKAEILVASNIPVLPSMVSVNAIENSMLAAAEYFLNNQSERGDFVYELYPLTGDTSDNYSIIREIASTWALAVFAVQKNDSELLHSAKRAAKYFLENYTTEVPEQNALVIMENGDSKLGSNALLLALLQELNDPDFKEEKEKLLNLVLSQQKPDGSLDPYFVNKNPKLSSHDFYPGEALVAIALEYKENPRPELLEALNKGFIYYRSYWRNHKSTAFVPWHSRAYYHLYQFTKNREVADFVLEMNDWMLGFQVLDTPYCSHFGGFRSTKNTSDVFTTKGAYSTGAYLESFVHAFAIADQLWNAEKREKYRFAVLSGLRQLMELQFSEENQYWIAAGEKAFGGIRSSIGNSTIRIDSQQHPLMAMIDTIRFFKSGDFVFEVDSSIQQRRITPEIKKKFFLVSSITSGKFIGYLMNGSFCSLASDVFNSS